MNLFSRLGFIQFGIARDMNILITTLITLFVIIPALIQVFNKERFQFAVDIHFPKQNPIFAPVFNSKKLT